jgi:hypothetical protein
MAERDDEREVRGPLGGGKNRESETPDDSDVEAHGGNRGPLGGGKNRDSETADDGDVEAHGGNRGPLGGGKN